MNFEVKNALLDLVQKTPEYFLRELWAHGKLEVKQSARPPLLRTVASRGCTRACHRMVAFRTPGLRLTGVFRASMQWYAWVASRPYGLQDPRRCTLRDMKAAPAGSSNWTCAKPRHRPSRSVLNWIWSM